ncbi:hypothetical protein GCM10010411_95880 [Actinomadura fulvescens]|uniref:HTH merR-type domain-containing protein n=1 Tax=Actinomadura fulvescens TaxID=46160 RepID=A0ABN3R102_9ACTN
MRLRPIDLAREHGLSAQAVRNYEEAGILPPAERSPHGYRIYAPRHAAALRTFMTLIPAHGHATAAAIMRAVNGGAVEEALRLVDESHAQLADDRRTLEAVERALRDLVPPPEPEPPHDLTPPRQLAPPHGPESPHSPVRSSSLAPPHDPDSPARSPVPPPHDLTPHTPRSTREPGPPRTPAPHRDLASPHRPRPEAQRGPTPHRDVASPHDPRPEALRGSGPPRTPPRVLASSYDTGSSHNLKAPQHGLKPSRHLAPPAPSADMTFIGPLARRLGIRPATLRKWERAGVVVPQRDARTGYRVYTSADVRDAQLAHQLRRGGHGLEQIARVLEQVRAAGGPEPLQATLKEWRDRLTARGLAMLAGAGALDAYLDTP